MCDNYLQFCKTTLNTVKYKLVPAGNYESLDVCVPQKSINLHVDEIANAAHCVLLHEFRRLQGDSVPCPPLGVVLYPRMSCRFGNNSVDRSEWGYPASVILMNRSNNSLRQARIEMIRFIHTIFRHPWEPIHDPVLTLDCTLKPYDEL